VRHLYESRRPAVGRLAEVGFVLWGWPASRLLDGIKCETATVGLTDLEYACHTKVEDRHPTLSVELDIEAFAYRIVSRSTGECGNDGEKVYHIERHPLWYDQ
jgi:hypothetical protein